MDKNNYIMFAEYPDIVKLEKERDIERTIQRSR